MSNKLLIALYLVAIVAANLVTAWGGAWASVAMSFVLIPFNLTVRDVLHHRWQNSGLWHKMALLIAAGSLLSAVLNINALPIAVASFCAFALAGAMDTLVYSRLKHYGRFTRMNGSNALSAAVDSFAFTTLAFGLPIMWGVIAADYAVKMLGGVLWSLVLRKVK